AGAGTHAPARACGAERALIHARRYAVAGDERTYARAAGRILCAHPARHGARAGQRRRAAGAPADAAVAGRIRAVLPRPGGTGAHGRTRRSRLPGADDGTRAALSAVAGVAAGSVRAGEVREGPAREERVGPRRLMRMDASRPASGAAARARLLHAAAVPDGEVRAQPGGELRFADGAIGQTQVLRVEGVVFRVQGAAVEHHENFACHGSSALVAVDERMVACKAMGQTGGEGGQVRRRVAMGLQLLRAGEGGIEQAVVAHATAAAMFGELAIMDGQSQR